MAKILIVEPDKLLAGTFKNALAAIGHGVATASTAQDAIFAADRSRPDIIILELQLVAHSGIEFLYELRSYPEWHNIPVLVVSLVPLGEAAIKPKILEEEFGVKSIFYKPALSLRQLVQAVEAALPVKAR